MYTHTHMCVYTYAPGASARHIGGHSEKRMCFCCPLNSLSPPLP